MCLYRMGFCTCRVVPSQLRKLDDGDWDYHLLTELLDTTYYGQYNKQ